MAAGQKQAGAGRQRVAGGAGPEAAVADQLARSDPKRLELGHGGGQQPVLGRAGVKLTGVQDALSVEREFGRLKNEWALLQLRVRGVEVRIHTDLTISSSSPADSAGVGPVR